MDFYVLCGFWCMIKPLLNKKKPDTNKQQRKSLELHKFHCSQQFFTMFRIKCTDARKKKIVPTGNKIGSLSQGEHTKRAIQWFSSFYESNQATINTFYSYAYAFAVDIGSCCFFCYSLYIFSDYGLFAFVIYMCFIKSFWCFC